MAEGDFAIVHRRYSGFGAPVNWVAAEVRFEGDGVVVQIRKSTRQAAAKRCTENPPE